MPSREEEETKKTGERVQQGTSRRITPPPTGRRSGMGRWIPLGIGAALLLGILSWLSGHRKNADHRAVGGTGQAGMVKRYQCAKSQVVSVEPLAKSQIRLSFQGTTYDLNRVPSASGERFTSGALAWHQKGDHGSLSAGDATLAQECVLLR